MGVSQAERLPADMKVALAMRRNFPELVRQADRLVAITIAKCWRMKLNDKPTNIQLAAYLRSASIISKFRIYAGAAMRYAKQLILNEVHDAKSQPVGDFRKPVHSERATNFLGAQK
jgi:hypothetical protein